MGRRRKHGKGHANSSAKRRRKKRLWGAQGGRCWWCQEPMLPLKTGPSDPLQARFPTLEHLNGKDDPLRGMAPPNQVRVVLACNECNQKRAQAQAARASAWTGKQSRDAASWGGEMGGP